MKNGRLVSAAAAFSVAAGSFNAFPASAVEKSELLDVSGFVIRDENFVHLSKGTYLRDVSYLFDEQDKVPESPDNLNVGGDVLKDTSKANWTPNQQMEYGAASFYMDLGANYVITAVAFLDTNGTPTWTISDGEPFSWHKIAEQNMNFYNSWRAIKFDKPEPTRYLHFSSDYCDSGVSEIAIYGYKQSELSDSQKKRTAPEKSLYPVSGETVTAAGKRLGFNAFIDDPITAMMSAGIIREYHNFSWMLDNDCKVKFTQGTWGDMDSYYKSLHDRGINVIPCIQGGSTAVSGGTKANEIPVKSGADTLDPKSYAVHARTMYQIAARYGSNSKIDPKTLNITDAQPAKTGLGYLNAVENSNEPNKSWAGKSNYFTPYELAAMCSADYDGHEGTIPDAGVHTADPSFKLAMGGLVGYSTMIQYLEEMKLWFDYNRSDGRFAVDIVNVHIGADSPDIEESSLRETIAELKKWMSQNAPDTELWISEFEVPMSDCEAEGTDAHDDENYQLRYAQRVARTYLCALENNNVDYITKFQLRDEGEGVYYNSGLVTQKGKWDKKLAWYYLSCMTNVLDDSVWTDETLGDGYWVNTFCSYDDRKLIKCANSWNSKSDGVYGISAEGRKYAYLTVPEMGIAEGRTTMLNIENDEVKVNITETPVFIMFTDELEPYSNGSNTQLRPAAISLTKDRSGEVCDLSAEPKDAVLNQFYRMFDEPDTMPDPVYGNTSALNAPETNVDKSGITGYVFFDKPCVFNGFAVFDTFGTGGISVYDANTDELLWSSDLGSYMSRSVTLTKDSAPTNCLKIVKDDGAMNELAFYGYKATASSWDADSDGRVDAFDHVLIRQSLVSNDAKYSIADLVGLTRFLLGM
ncbi:MAG: hypothetical protein J6P14_01640 [Ruminococcus sp.]|nr:hypothetical protein [Ruminococcus sp.]